MRLYHQHKYSQPTIDSLKTTLRSVLEEAGQIFLVIDALDECIDENERRAEILNLLMEFSNWALPQVHILVTSRKEEDIEKALMSLKMLSSICIKTQQKNDIELYVRSILATDVDLRKWTDEVKEEIAEALTRNAGGM
jgi:archaellum biogenesis ATPase FlaH